MCSASAGGFDAPQGSLGHLFGQAAHVGLDDGLQQLALAGVHFGAAQPLGPDLVGDEGRVLGDDVGRGLGVDDRAAPLLAVELKEQLATIGESNRMTLKFRKPS